MKVRHEVWGDGMVLNSRLQDGDETIDIFFEQVGLKRLAASLARLDIMER
jgi:DNA helicase-2/ATP-dependent DNA helicase PcrA